MARHIKFVALAHESKILASYLHWDKEASEEYEDVLKQIFASPGWAAVREQNKRKLELKSNRNIYCIEIDLQGRVYVIVITDAYPIRYIFSSTSGGTTPKIMTEFHDFVVRDFRHESISSPEKGLKRSLRPYLKELATRFDDLESLDKINTVQAKVDNLKVLAEKNMVLMDEREGLLERQTDRSKNMSASAKQMFQTGSAASRRNACCGRRKYLWWIGTFLLLAAAIVLILGWREFGWFGNTSASPAPAPPAPVAASPTPTPAPPASASPQARLRALLSSTD